MTRQECRSLRAVFLPLFRLHTMRVQPFEDALCGFRERGVLVICLCAFVTVNNGQLCIGYLQLDPP